MRGGFAHQPDGLPDSRQLLEAVGEPQLAAAGLDHLTAGVDAKFPGNVGDSRASLPVRLVDRGPAGRPRQEPKEGRAFMGLDPLEGQIEIETRLAAAAAGWKGCCTSDC